MIREALDDAGLTIGDVDGVCYAGMATGLAEYLGVHPRFIDGTMVGGSSYQLHVEHAAAAITAGLCDVVVSVYASTPRSDRKRGQPQQFGPQPGPNPMFEWEMPYGLRLPMGAYALAASAHMARFGTTSEQLAQIAVSTRQWAGLNPWARYRDPITIDDVLASPMVSSPLHLLDCCLVTDAGGAVVLTSAERARDLPNKPIHVLGTGEAATHVLVSQMPNFAFWDAAKLASDHAFAMAGVAHADIDLAMFYDAFTIVPVMGLEATGFCKPGEGGAFVSGGRTAPGGPFPMNTNGGGLSYTHSGMYGMFMLVEAVRQLRGEGDARQVAGAKTAICHGLGGMFSASATLICGTEIPD